MTRQNKAVLLGAIAVLSWSTVATAFKIALSHLSVFEMVFVASVSALIVFSLLLTIERRWRLVKQLSARSWGVLALMGLINPVAYYLVLFRSYDLLPAQVAQPINYAWPIVLLVLLAVFNREAIPVRKYIGMALSLGGVACISLGGSAITGTLSVGGIALGLLSALLWATYWMVNNRVKDSIDAGVTFFGSFLFGSLYMAVAAPFVGVDLTETAGLLSGAYIGCFEMGVPFICFGMAMRMTDNPALINQMCYLSPFMSLFFISTVLGEPIVLSTYIGLVLIVGGIVYNQYFAGSRKSGRVATGA